MGRRNFSENENFSGQKVFILNVSHINIFLTFFP